MLLLFSFPSFTPCRRTRPCERNADTPITRVIIHVAGCSGNTQITFLPHQLSDDGMNEISLWEHTIARVNHRGWKRAHIEQHTSNKNAHFWRLDSLNGKTGWKYFVVYNVYVLKLKDYDAIKTTLCLSFKISHHISTSRFLCLNSALPFTGLPRFYFFARTTSSWNSYMDIYYAYLFWYRRKGLFRWEKLRRSFFGRKKLLGLL